MTFRSLITGQPVKAGATPVDRSPEGLASLLDGQRGGDAFAHALAAGRETMDGILARYAGSETEAGAALASWIMEDRRIAVFGDFDVDGLTSVAIASCGIAILKGMDWQEENLRQRIAACGVIPMIPERSDGYGVQPRSVDAAIALGAQAMLVLDSGSGAAAGLQRAIDVGLPIVVLDHHAVQPDVAGIVDRRPLTLVFQNAHDARYRGAGHPAETCTGHMTLALILETATRCFSDLRDLAGHGIFEALAALSVVADMMDLDGDKRVLVRSMLSGLDGGAGPGGLRALIAAARDRGGVSLAKIDPRKREPIGDIDCETLGFSIAPRLNSLARSGLAEEGLWFILSSFQEAARRLDAVDRVNGERQAVQHDVSQAVLDTVTPFLGPARTAAEILDIYPDRDAVRASALVAESADGQVQALIIPGLFIIASAPFHLGVAGLVAGTIAMRSGTPVLVTASSGQDGHALHKGSGRVPERHPVCEGVLEDAFGAMVAALAAQIGGGGGGHNAAFGVSFMRSTIDDPAFVEFAVEVAMLIRSSFEQVEPDRLVLRGAFDLLATDPVDAAGLYEACGAFMPFGKGLKAPLIALPAKAAKVEERASSTLMVQIGEGPGRFKAVGFAKQMGSSSILRRTGVFDALASGDAFLVGEMSRSFFGHDRLKQNRAWRGPSVEMKISDIIVRD